MEHKEKHLQELNAESRLQTEMAMMTMCPYISYLVAEGLELSGIVAILCNGILLIQYCRPNLRTSTQKAIKFLYETAAYVSESFVFVFLGMGLFAFDHPYSQLSWTFVLGTLINLNLARFLNITIVSFLANCTRKENKLTFKTQMVMWLSGLRGAMAYALAMQATIDFKNGDLILLVSLLYALFTILI
jgi:sodium/hydrogen exchanger 8